MKLLTLAILLVTLPLRGSEPGTAAASAEITHLLTAQAAAWNRGDLVEFMQGYAQTDDLRFASGAKVTYGWKATLAGYQRRYPDRAAMGNLAFSDLTVTLLSPSGAIAFGRWKLTREKDAPEGLFTLTLVKAEKGWRIIQDHTSSAP